MTVTQIQIRRDTAANWTSANPTLAIGEMGIETDSKKIKVGDGTTAWTSLLYFLPSFASSLSTDALLTDTTLANVFAGHAIGANETWVYDIMMWLGAGSEDLKYAIAATVPAGASLVLAPVQGGISELNDPVVVSGDKLNAAYLAAGSYNFTLYVKNGSTAGTVQIKHSTNSNGVGTTTVKAGSFLRGIRAG